MEHPLCARLCSRSWWLGQERWHLGALPALKTLGEVVGGGDQRCLAEDCALQIGALQLTSPKGVHPVARAGQPLDASPTACCKKAYLEPKINQHVK